MEYKNIAILLTGNCNAKCTMCCDSRGIVKGETLSKENLEKILYNIKKCTQITSVGVTGGEPMLYPELVEAVLNYDYGRPMDLSIKTNGFWGKDINKARAFIEKNISKINAISFSYDEFHQKYIDINSIKNLIDLCIEYNIQTEIVGCFMKDGISPGKIIDDFGEYAFKTKYLYQPVINTGRAKELPQSKFIKLLDSERDQIHCLSTLESMLLINAQMEVYPCCSQVIENTILCLGNLKEATLTEIIDDISCNKIFNTLFMYGFTPFIDLLHRKGREFPQKLTCPCELCEFLFTNDWFMKILKEEKFYETI